MSEDEKITLAIRQDNEAEAKGIAALKEALGIGENDRFFFHTPFRIRNAGEVFVLREVDCGNGERDVTWDRCRKDALQPGDKLVKCVIDGCEEPAYQIDHCCPCEMYLTRCIRHRHTEIDDELYNRTGIAKEIEKSTEEPPKT